MQHKPNDLKTPVIYYEVVSDGAEKALSRFFASRSPLESRDQALRYFLEQFFYIEVKREETVLYVYCRHHKGERILLLSSQMFAKPGSNFYGLKRELFMYHQERIAVHLALFNPSNPQWIKIFFPRSCEAAPERGGVHFLLASQYWIFLRQRREQYRI